MNDGSNDMSEARIKGWPTLNSPEDADATHRWARACLEMWEAERADLLAKVERLREERQAVLDCINLYGDETLHSALDGIGWPAEAEAEIERLRAHVIDAIRAAVEHASTREHFVRRLDALLDELGDPRSDITAPPPDGRAPTS